MKVILFRGKRTDNGEWVSGSLIGNDYILNYFDQAEIWATEPSDQKVTCRAYQVNTATVGQLTGLKDKNGKEIYDRDILMDGKGGSGVVVYTAPQFTVQVGDNLFALAEGKVNMQQLEYTEIIGNIHDTPELRTV